MSPLLPGSIRTVLRHPKVRRVAWLALGLGAADLILLVFLFGPLALKHSRLVSAIAADRRSRLEALQAHENSANYGRLTQEVTGLESRWSRPANQSELVEAVSRLSARCGLKVISQDFNVSAPKGGGKVFKQDLSCLGDYDSFRRFFRELDSFPNLTVVEQVRLDRAGEKGDRVRASLELWTFSRPSGKGDPAHD